MNKLRMEVVDYGPLLTTGTFQPLVVQRNSEPNPWGFLNPFHFNVWIYICLSFLLSVFALSRFIRNSFFHGLAILLTQGN